MKKFLVILMAICMMASLLCVSAFAADSADEPDPGTVLRVSALKKNGDSVLIKDYDNFTNGWNYAMGLAADGAQMEENSYERVVVDFYADWNAVLGGFNDNFSDGNGFYNDAIYIPEGAKVTVNMKGHTIDRGLSREKSYGEIMYIDNKADVIINDGTITGGYGASGDAGGMDIQYNAKVTLNKVHVIGNRSKWDGGGIFVGSGSILTVNGGSFKNNAGTAGYWYDSSYGGAVHVEGTAIFDGVEFKENVSPYGAAISADKGNVVISNCTFDSNGIQNANKVVSDNVIYADESKINITNSTFTNNEGEDLFYFEDSEALIEGGKVTSNKSEELFCFEDSKADIKFVTITDNASKTLYIDNGSKVVTMIECILGNNTPATDDFDVEVDDKDTFIMRDCTFGDTTFEDDDYVKVEYTGVPEKEALISVTKLNKDGTKETTYHRFFEYGWNFAIEAAMTNRYDRIIVDLLADWNALDGEFTDNFYNGVGFDWDAIYVPENVKVTLNMNGHTINRGLTSEQDNGEVICIDKNADVIINDGTIKGGYSDNGAGGIHIKDGATVTLNNVNVVENGVQGDDGAGIAVYNGATLIMNGGSISRNKMEQTYILISNICPYGALYVDNATAILDKVTISDNDALFYESEGVAIYAKNSTVTMNDCTVSGNAVKKEAEKTKEALSVVAAVNSKLTITNTNFTKNGSTVYIPGSSHDSFLFDLLESSLVMENCKVTENNPYQLFYFKFSDGDLKNVTITDNNAFIIRVRSEFNKVTLTECVLNNNTHDTKGTDIGRMTSGTLAMIDCDLGDTTFADKGDIDFGDGFNSTASIFGEGSLTTIVAITALIASAAAIVVSVSSKKKAVPATSNNVAESEDEE